MEYPQNSLSDFDLCLAVSQQAINSQFADAWETWLERKNKGKTKLERVKDLVTMRIPIRNAKTGRDTGRGLEATFGPPTIELNVPGALGNQLRLTLKIPKGSVTYLDVDEDTPVNKTEPLKDCTLHFMVDLKREGIDLKTLKAMDPVTAGQVGRVIGDSDLADAVFSIEYLFMTVTNKNFRMAQQDLGWDYGSSRVSEEAKKTVADCIALFLKKQEDKEDYADRLMLGAVVYPKKERARPTFALRDFVFHINRQSAHQAEASTLSYMGALGTRELPAAGAPRDAALNRMDKYWMDPGKVTGARGSRSGIMVVRKQLITDLYFPAIQRALENAVNPDAGASKSFDSNPAGGTMRWVSGKQYDTSGWWEKEIVEVGRQWDLKVSPKVDDNCIELSGEIHCRVHKTHYDRWGSVVLKKVGTLGIAGTHDIDKCIIGTAPITGKIKLDLSDPIAGEFKTQFEFHVGDVTPKTEKEKKGFWDTKFLPVGVWQLFAGGEEPEAWMKHKVSDMSREMRDALKAAVSSIKVDLGNQRFIPPGNGVFKFGDVKFSRFGDLTMDVTYSTTAGSKK